jgi:hypothetical protein
MSDDRTIEDLDRDDDTRKTSQQRLESVERIVVRAHRRIDNINNNFQPPPDDGKPAMLRTLGNIKAEAQAVIDVAGRIEAKLR